VPPTSSRNVLLWNHAEKCRQSPALSTHVVLRWDQENATLSRLARANSWPVATVRRNNDWCECRVRSGQWGSCTNPLTASPPQQSPRAKQIARIITQLVRDATDSLEFFAICHKSVPFLARFVTILVLSCTPLPATSLEILTLSLEILYLGQDELYQSLGSPGRDSYFFSHPHQLGD
jgi:hypothetical protein